MITKLIKSSLELQLIDHFLGLMDLPAVHIVYVTSGRFSMGIAI